MSLSSDLTLISDMASRLSIIALSEADKASMSYELHCRLLDLFKKVDTVEGQLNGTLVEEPGASTSDFGGLDLIADLQLPHGSHGKAVRTSFDNGDPYPVCSSLIEWVAFWGRSPL